MALKLFHAKTPKEKPAPKVSEKVARFPATGGAKYVLFLGDEGAILVYIRGRKVLSRQYVRDASEHHLREFSDSLSRDPKAPIFFVIDSIDQAHVQQSLPPVSSLGVGKLIKRRLERDFGANDIKGALPLGREKTGRKDWNFLMVSIERTPMLSEWLDYVGELPNRLAGIFLLSVETENIIKHLDRILEVPKDPEIQQWKFLISHNKVGGFRQVILRNGRIVFTRITQPIGESTPEVLAGNIEQESLGTVEYMKRLGFTPQGATLDVYVITSNAVRSVLDLNKLHARSTHVMTPHEMSQTVGIEGATQPGDQFGDVILAACIGCSRRHVLTLNTPYFRKTVALHRFMQFQRVAAAAMVVGAFGYSASLGYDFYESYQKSTELADRKVREERDLLEIKEDIKRSALDVERISNIIELYKEALLHRISPLPMLMRLDGFSRLPVVIKKIDWKIDDGGAGGGGGRMGGGAGEAAPINMAAQNITAVITFEFENPGDNREILNVQASRVMTFFKDALPEYQVAYNKAIEVSKDNGNLDISFDREKEKTTDLKPVEMEMTVSGPVIFEDTPKPTKEEVAARGGASAGAPGAATPGMPPGIRSPGARIPGMPPGLRPPGMPPGAP